MGSYDSVDNASGRTEPLQLATHRQTDRRTEKNVDGNNTPPHYVRWCKNMKEWTQHSGISLMKMRKRRGNQDRTLGDAALYSAQRRKAAIDLNTLAPVGKVRSKQFQ